MWLALRRAANELFKAVTAPRARGRHTVRADQPAAWDRLHRSYREDGIVLVLGSGVSFDSRLPNWETLVERLAADRAPEVGKALFDRLRRSGLSLPVIASVIEERSGSRAKFVERVRDALYSEFPFYRAGVGGDDRKRFLDHVECDNKTLRAVAALCVCGDKGGAYSPNGQIRAVISLNLDQLLQKYIRARYRRRLLRTIESPSASSSAKRIGIYHIHGFLRFDRKARIKPKEGAYAMVLTEQDYFNVYNDPLSVFNYTFMYHLRESACLFVGLSMQDENVRRLLHFSKMERLRGYKNEGRRVVRDERLLRHFAILKRNDCPEVDDAIEESLRPLGTTALWIEDYPEIPSRLQSLYGDGWPLVYDRPNTALQDDRQR